MSTRAPDGFHPDDPEPTPEVRALGRPERIIHTRTGQSLLIALVRLFAGGSAWILIVAAAIGCGAYLIPSQPPLAYTLIAVGALVGLVMAVLGRQVADWPERYYVFREAFAHPHPDGQWSIVRWDEVVEVTPVGGVCPTAELALTDGTVLRVPATSGSRTDFREEIEKRTHPHALTDATSAWDAGETVFFGPLGVDRDGLEYNGRRLAWDEVREIELGRSKEGKETDGLAVAAAITGGLVGLLAYHAMKSGGDQTTSRLLPRLAIQRRADSTRLGLPMGAWYTGDLRTIPNRAVLVKLLLAAPVPGHAIRITKGVATFLPDV